MSNLRKILPLCQGISRHTRRLKSTGYQPSPVPQIQGDPKYIKQEISKFDPTVPIEKAVTPPASWYVTNEFHELDKRSVFGKEWIAVGLVSHIKEPGCYITGFLADEPYLITMDDTGALRGFYNVCRHHATLVMDNKCGKAERFECPYHGWTYDLKGRLTKATRLKGIKDFKARDFGLKPIDIDVWGSMIFIRLGDNGIDLHDWLKPITDGLQKGGFSTNLQRVASKEYHLKCNWKVFVDNYLDGGYHVEYAHKDLNAKLNSKSYTTELFDGFSIQSSSGAESNTETGSKCDRIGSSVFYAHIFPNLMINRYGPWLDINYTYPIDQNNCKVVFDWLLEQEVIDSMTSEELDEFVKQDLKDSEQVQDEDIWLCERVQKGLNSRSYEWGRYAPGVEKADHEFHQRLIRSYTIP